MKNRRQESEYIEGLRNYLMEEIGLSEKEAVWAMIHFDLREKMMVNFDEQIGMSFQDVVHAMIAEGILKDEQ